MNHTAVSSFTQAAQQAQQWVNELADDLDWNERRVYRLLRSVLHARSSGSSTISQGEIVQVRNSIKKSLRQLWPAH